MAHQLTPDYAGRSDRLAALLAADRDATFITVDPGDVEYLTGVPWSPACVLVVRGAKPVLFIDEARWNGANAVSPYAEMHKIRSGESVPSRVIQFCSERSLQSLVCEDLPFSLVETLAREKSLTVTRASDLLRKLRRQKDPYEQDLLRQAAELGDRCMHAARTAIKPGVTELEVAAEVDREVKAGGGNGTWFPTVVSSGTRAAHPVYPATSKTIEDGHMVVVDIGAKLGGYCSDITRTFIVGRGNDRALEILTTVLEAQQQALARVRSGVAAEEVDATANAVIRERGFGEHITHAVGHGIGLFKEPPLLAPGSKDRLVVGDCVTVEPGIYVVGFGGARIEDDLLVLEDGAEVLTHFPKDIKQLML